MPADPVGLDLRGLCHLFRHHVRSVGDGAMKMELSRHIDFAELEWRTAWLGGSPTDKRIEASFEEIGEDGGIPFYVNNGGWNGTLYQEPIEGALHIIDARGVRHDAVYIVELVENALEQAETDEDRIPY
ncbi:hypothetical protein B7L88_gp155 [Rhizobium phage RHEph10]|uniref:hypothetical protein n=1 Tax=Rhizobium phage RHEph10 TaxID=1220717 RepID=UPI0002AAFB4C|nr:hypothetical protein B7L88_gp155 [Rhizobium phage RHEph10]AGC36133.1 hypothetical protein RHEph10_gp090 [Rhizobium phage RHEph10]